MFAQDDFLPELERRFREEVLEPMEEQSAAKLAIVRQVYPPATKIVAMGIFFLVGLALNKAISRPKRSLEERLEVAADKLVFWGPQKKRRKR